MAETTVELERSHIDAIRDALIIGLASYGEIERLENAQQLAAMRGERTIPDEVTESLKVVHPTGDADTVSKFATALALLEGAQRASAEEA